MTKPVHLPAWMRLSVSDPVRTALQTAVAAVAAYFVGRAIGQDTVSWAVFAAVFVVQGNIGGTLATAVGRVEGAATGILLALAAVFTIGHGGYRTVLSLAAAIGVMSFLSGRRPGLSYGLVTVTMIVLAPGFDIVENAFERSAAILGGTIAGAAASVLVMPRAARREARRAAARILSGCADLLRASLEALTDGAEERLLDIHQRIETDIGLARQMSTSARKERLLSRRATIFDPPLLDVERIWYSLAVLDRLSRRQIAASVAPDLKEPVRAAGEEAARAIEQAADAMVDGRPPERLCVPERLADLDHAIDDLRRRDKFSALSREDLEQVMAIAFALEEIWRNITQLTHRKGDG